MPQYRHNGGEWSPLGSLCLELVAKWNSSTVKDKLMFHQWDLSEERRDSFLEIWLHICWLVTSSSFFHWCFIWTLGRGSQKCKQKLKISGIPLTKYNTRPRPEWNYSVSSTFVPNWKYYNLIIHHIYEDTKSVYILFCQAGFLSYCFV